MADPPDTPGAAFTLAGMLTLFVKRYRFIHTAIAMAGSAIFVAGSILFMLDASKAAGVLFIAGSVGMFLGNLGQLLTDRELSHWRQEAIARSRRPLDIPDRD